MAVSITSQNNSFTTESAMLYCERQACRSAA